MKIQLSDHFGYGRLLRFVLPSVMMMIFTSMYSIVDGVFVSNFVGKTSFAAVNLIMPIGMAVGTVGFMIGTGGSAIVSKTFGEGKPERANRYFTMLVISAVVLSTVLSVVGIIFAPSIASALGAEGQLLHDCVVYGRLLFSAQPAFVVQNVFQSFFVTAEKPGLSLKVSVMSGLTNIILDALFIIVFKWGIAGAALATGAGQLIGALVPVFYFARKNSSILRFTKTRFESKVLLKACTNGSSEMVANLSASLVNIMYNFQLMRFAGENGVAAYGVIMYANFIFMAVFFGYALGSAPVVSYHFGAANHDELKNLFKKSIVLMLISGMALTLLAEFLSSPLIKIFAGYDAELFSITRHGFRIYAAAFILMGFNVWGSAFFTALNNGVISAIISFLRTLVFQIAAVWLLPVLLGMDGIWLSIVAAEILSLTLTLAFIVKNRKRYHYA